MKTTRLKWDVSLSQASVLWVRLCLAFFFVIITLCQLFAFEDFPDVIASYGLPLIGPGISSVFVAILIVAIEVAAVPVLLDMELSEKARRISMVAVWITLGYWLVIGLWQSFTPMTIENAGLFGANVPLPQGWWLVSLMLALIVIHGFVGYCHLRKK